MICFDHFGGVGEKSALLYLQTVTGKAEGIAVDSHLHAIANSLGWVNTKRPEQTRRKLEEILPAALWSTINPLVVGFLANQKPSTWPQHVPATRGAASGKERHREREREIRMSRTFFSESCDLQCFSVKGFGQEMATDKSKILTKCINSSNPTMALQMLSDCGMNVTREPLGIASTFGT